MGRSRRARDRIGRITEAVIAGIIVMTLQWILSSGGWSVDDLARIGRQTGNRFLQIVFQEELSGTFTVGIALAAGLTAFLMRPFLRLQRLVARIAPESIEQWMLSLGVRPQDSLVPLEKAARFLYEQARADLGGHGAAWARGAERLSGMDGGELSSGSPEEIMNWIAVYMSRHVAIFGTRPPSRRREPIFDKGGQFLGGAMRYKTRHDIFTRLAIEHRDLQRLLEDIKKSDARVRTGAGHSDRSSPQP